MLLYLLKISKKVITSWTFGRREKMLTLLIQALTMVFMQLLFFLFLLFQVLVRIFLTHAM